MSGQNRREPHPLKHEIERRGFVKAKIALRVGETSMWLYARLYGRVPMSPEDEARIRAAMDPDGDAGDSPAAVAAVSA